MLVVSNRLIMAQHMVFCKTTITLATAPAKPCKIWNIKKNVNIFGCWWWASTAQGGGGWEWGFVRPQSPWLLPLPDPAGEDTSRASWGIITIGAQIFTTKLDRHKREIVFSLFPHQRMLNRQKHACKNKCTLHLSNIGQVKLNNVGILSLYGTHPGGRLIDSHV